MFVWGFMGGFTLCWRTISTPRWAHRRIGCHGSQGWTDLNRAVIVDGKLHVWNEAWIQAVGYWNTLKANIAMQNVLLWKKTCVKAKQLLDFCGVMVGGFTRYYLLCTKLPGVITPEQPEIHWVTQAQNWWLCWDPVINFGMNQASTTLLWTFTTNWWLKPLVPPCGFSAGYVMLGLCFQKVTVQPEKPT